MPTKIRVKINTTKDILEARNTSIEDLQGRMQCLITYLGKKYLSILPINIVTSQEIDLIIRLSNIFRKLHSYEGFERHIKLYNKKELHSHMFVSAVASHFCDIIDKLVLEPVTPPNEGNGKRLHTHCHTRPRTCGFRPLSRNRSCPHYVTRSRGHSVSLSLRCRPTY